MALSRSPMLPNWSFLSAANSPLNSFIINSYRHNARNSSPYAQFQKHPCGGTPHFAKLQADRKSPLLVDFGQSGDTMRNAQVGNSVVHLSANTSVKLFLNLLPSLALAVLLSGAVSVEVQP